MNDDAIDALLMAEADRKRSFKPFSFGKRSRRLNRELCPECGRPKSVCWKTGEENDGPQAEEKNTP